jgi:hypothetical protein
MTCPKYREDFPWFFQYHARLPDWKVISALATAQGNTTHAGIGNALADFLDRRLAPRPQRLRFPFSDPPALSGY